MQECVFDQVPLSIEMAVECALNLAVFARRNFRLHALCLSLFNNGIAVIALVGNQMLGAQTGDQVCSFCAICAGSFCSKDSDRHTMRIHGQMYLGVEPPFVRPIP